MNILKNLRDNKFLFIFFGLVFFLFVLFFQKNFNGFLSFSDAAKFADVARNLVSGNGYTSNFTFFNSEALKSEWSVSVFRWTQPVMPLAIAFFFKLLGISDLSVVATSSFFYVLLVLTTYFLGKKLWGHLVGLLGALAIASNINFLEYASSGASEILFTFEILLGAYFIILKKRWANICGFLVLVAMYFTKAQAIIYIFGLLFLFFILNFTLRKALGYFVVSFVVGSFIYLFVSKQGFFAVTQHLPGVASSDALRGAVQEINISGLFKKVFYNIYNFYRFLPQIASPYMWGLFVIGLFHWTKNKAENSLKAATIFMVSVTFLITALTIPFFRYLHPVVPLVYLFAVSTLVWILGEISKSQTLNSKQYLISKFKLSKQRFIILTSSFLILFFVVGQTLGVIFLDSRFNAERVNKGKPPVYVQLSYILRDVTNPDDVVVTNLDTWGSWYGERKTIWFPLKPEQLRGMENKIDAIFLTSYLIDDENYYMGDEWRQIFYDPESKTDEFISGNYELTKVFEVSASENYERQDVRAILLVKKNRLGI